MFPTKLSGCDRIDGVVFKGQLAALQKHFGAILQLSDNLMLRILFPRWETMATCLLDGTLYNLSVL